MKKVALLGLALVLALGSLGFAYAKWSDSVTLSKTVNTDYIDVYWGTITPWDDCSGPSNDYNLDLSQYPDIVTYYREVKNVGCTTVEGIGTDSLLVTVTNAYPLYYCDVEVEFCNRGSVPVKLADISAEPVGNWSLASAAWTEPDCDGAIWVDTVDGVGTQIDPGDCKAASVKFVVQECAEQDATYQFMITWTVINWNEYGYFDPVP
jgi:hypothetical protein